MTPKACMYVFAKRQLKEQSHAENGAIKGIPSIQMYRAYMGPRKGATAFK